MKKTILALLGFMLLLSMFSCASTNQDGNNTTTTLPPDIPESPVEDFAYQELDDGTIAISYKGTDENVVVPRFINDKPVTTIAPSGFQSAKSFLKTVTLPDTITTIRPDAFMNCTLLASINLPASLSQIGARAFENCASLKSIEISSDCLNEYSWEAFAMSGLESIILNEGVTYIPDVCFAATKIEEIKLPSTIKEIGSQAFSSCPNLVSIELNEGLEIIGNNAFAGKSKLTEIIIPSTVTDITEMAFNGCSTLEKVKFEGNAPEQYRYPEDSPIPMIPYDVHYTVYYHETAIGFSSPEWNGYQTEIWP